MSPDKKSQSQVDLIILIIRTTGNPDNVLIILFSLCLPASPSNIFWSSGGSSANQLRIPRANLTAQGGLERNCRNVNLSCVYFVLLRRMVDSRRIAMNHATWSNVTSNVSSRHMIYQLRQGHPCDVTSDVASWQWLLDWSLQLTTESFGICGRWSCSLPRVPLETKVSLKFHVRTPLENKLLQGQFFLSSHQLGIFARWKLKRMWAIQTQLNSPFTTETKQRTRTHTTGSDWSEPIVLDARCMHTCHLQETSDVFFFFILITIFSSGALLDIWRANRRANSFYL